MPSMSMTCMSSAEISRPCRFRHQLLNMIVSPCPNSFSFTLFLSQVIEYLWVVELSDEVDIGFVTLDVTTEGRDALDVHIKVADDRECELVHAIRHQPSVIDGRVARK